LLAVLFIVAVLALPTVASAHRRWHGHAFIGPGWWGPGWWGPPAPVYLAPEPVPVCRDVWIEGRWVNRGRSEPSGFTTYHQEWVPGHWERLCP
jgi:hypothetical protein